MKSRDTPADPASGRPRRFRKVLVANRGEVALRVFRACRQLGIATVAVYSDADRASLHVAEADEAFHVGGSRVADSYLNIARILAALDATSADAVHPGFGFLAENATFAAAVRAHGATFIGPAPEVIGLMGSKAEARGFVRALGVPVIPGDDDADQGDARLAAAARRIGYPLLIKAAAGGGGVGIRMVRREEEFPMELASARSEARASFGDPRVILERCFEGVRHVEVQVVADTRGAVVHCFDRECSIQRRRQKIIEEAPATSVAPSVRAAMARAAVRIAEATGYVGLGTVEFLVDDAAQAFYFLEMNTRLQVEHGITELVTGLDLVRWQIEIAEGRPLGLGQEQITARGHAVECRLYAEVPEAGFAPATGRILQWRTDAGPDIRVDTAVESGAEITADYDPMLGKLMAWGPDRAAALRRIRGALVRTQVLGVATNQRFLLRAVDHADFDAGRTTTQFVEQHSAALCRAPDDSLLDRVLLVAALMRSRAEQTAPGVGATDRRYRLRVAAREASVRLQTDGAGRYRAHVDQNSHELQLLRASDDREVVVEVDGHAMRHGIAHAHNALHVTIPGGGSCCVEFLSRFWSRPAPEPVGCYRAAMTGRILDVLVAPGSRVRTGDRLLTMESMKMEHATVAGIDGIVSQLWATPGAVVDKGTLLVEIESESAVAESADAGA